MFLFEHDLRANAFRVCREGKPVPTFPDHALRAAPGAITKAVVTTASNMPLKRMPMTILPKIGNCTVPIDRIILALAYKATVGFQKGPPQISKGTIHHKVGW